MAEQNSTTETPGNQGSTIQRPSAIWLSDLLNQALWPITVFIKELENQNDGGQREDIDQLLTLLVPLMDTVEANLDVIGEVLDQSLGNIEVENTEKLRNFGGFRRGDFGKAIIVATEPQAAAQGGAA
jgi:hypothetical protein